MAKRGRKGWKQELELKNLAKLCEQTLLKALKSKAVSNEKKIDIAKVILPRFIPKDINFTASGKIEHHKITLITSETDADIIDIDAKEPSGDHSGANTAEIPHKTAKEEKKG